MMVQVNGSDMPAAFEIVEHFFVADESIELICTSHERRSFLEKPRICFLDVAG
jgi:hypothetical protein